MTERVLPLADGASACPFVAFEDDRDERATVPDHRHRCYAEPQPAPRALAHQEAYCLSSAFPVCPIFQDWARREAARARADTARNDAAAAASAASAASAAVAAGPGADADVDDDGPARAPDRHEDDVIHRNPPRNWAAPPPWLASRDQPRDEAEPPAFLGRRVTEPGQGLAGSPADRFAGGSTDRADEVDDDHGRWSSSAAVAASVGSSRRARPPVDDDGPEGEEDEEPRRPVRRPRAYDQHLGGTSGPDWERPRRQEAYPMIRSRVGMPNVSRIAGLAILVGLLAVGLFFLPGILGIGSPSNPGGAARPSASTAAAPSVSIAPTQPPAPTPRIYTIKKGDSLSKIAAANGITIEELMAANPTIKDPNRIAEGQEITLPAPSEAPPDEIGESATP